VRKVLMTWVEGTFLRSMPFQDSVLAEDVGPTIVGTLDTSDTDSISGRGVNDVLISHPSPSLKTSALENVRLNRWRTVSSDPKASMPCDWRRERIQLLDGTSDCGVARQESFISLKRRRVT
jgi:hypothetical protein